MRNPTAAIVLNPPSLARYAPLVQSGGVLIVNSALVAERAGRADIPDRRSGQGDRHRAGFPQIANVVLIGALIATTRVVLVETVERVLAAHLGAHHRAALAANQEALHRGATFLPSAVPVQCVSGAPVRRAGAWDAALSQRFDEEPRSATMQTLWDYRYAQRTQRMTGSVIRELLEFTEEPDIISLRRGHAGPGDLSAGRGGGSHRRVLHVWGRRRSNTAPPRAIARCAK